MTKRFLLIASLLAAFAAGVGAERLATGVTMRGKVMDANTVPEPVEYWEVRGAAGESVVILGKNDLPLIQWLRRAKNRTIVVSIDTAPDVSSR